MPRLAFDEGESYELCPGHVLRRATDEEVDKIREFVGDALSFGSLFRAYYESGIADSPQGKQVMTRPQSYWKYCVVAFAGVGEELGKLGFALDFLPSMVALPITWYDSGGFAWNMSYLGHDMMPRLQRLISIKNEEKFPSHLLPTIRAIFDKLKALADNDPLMRPFSYFHSLKRLPSDSDAYVLGLFSVVEMILTHKPDEKLHDSLRHQVSAKMNLLSRRFMKNEILIAAYPGIDSVPLWKALYDWRSKIAHGDEPDFKTGSLSKLESLDKARLFLDLHVRLLLKETLDEPQLIADLKKC